MTAQHCTQYRKDYRSPDYSIDEIDLEFTLDDTCTRVVAKSKVQRLVDDAKATLDLDGEQLKLLRIEVNGHQYTDYTLTDSQLILSHLPASFELCIETEIAPAENTALEGLYKSAGAYCTQCEAQGFRRITWYLDRPDVLAKYSTKIIANKSDYPYLLSNGNEIARGDLEGGRHWVQWRDPFPKPCYLFALVAGQFDLLEDSFTTRSGREVALQLFVEPGNLSKGQHALDSLKRAMAWDESRFNLEYDLDIYMVVAVDFFNMGAMENKGLNVFNAKFVLADPSCATDQDFLNIEAVIGHEYFHNWTGNRVTCRDWFQLSLKEGLTVFRDQEFSSDLGSRTVNRIQSVRTMRGPQFSEDAGPMAHPIRPDAVMEMNNFYTVTVYNKGSEVIRMLHLLLGETVFMQGIALYLQTFDGKAATCEDFIQAMEKVSAKDLSQFRLWYSTAGTPKLTVTDSYDPQTQVYQLTVSQQSGLAMPAMHIPLDIELLEFDGQDLRASQTLLELTEMEQSFTFEGLKVKPVPALLREFSAPVRLHYAAEAQGGLEEQGTIREQEQALIIAHASNEFNRWDATQQLYFSAIDKSLNAQGRNKYQAQFSQSGLDAITELLTAKQADSYFISALLTLPTESELAQNYDQVDVEGLSHARHCLFDSLASHLSPLLEKTYQDNKAKAYRFEQQSIGARALKNCALNYLAKSKPELVELQYQAADNMTDSLAALTAANQHNLPCLEAMMSDFESRWHHEPLVMDKWLTLKAMRPGVRADELRSLFEHSVFSFSNPNRVRALIGSFANNNPMAFHEVSGSGYQLLTEVISKLNTLNPQVAARMIDPLLRFKRYDARRQALMKQALGELSELEGLSRDLFEKISKALA